MVAARCGKRPARYKFKHHVTNSSRACAQWPLDSAMSHTAVACVAPIVLPSAPGTAGNAWTVHQHHGPLQTSEVRASVCRAVVGPVFSQALPRGGRTDPNAGSTTSQHGGWTAKPPQPLETAAGGARGDASEQGEVEAKPCKSALQGPAPTHAIPHTRARCVFGPVFPALGC